MSSNLAQVLENGEVEEAARAWVLIVDDIADNRTILRRRLERRNFTVIEADNGLLALEIIRRGECDIVLLDVMMPEMDGIQVLHAIRNDVGDRSLPVIMVTAKSQTEDIVSALEVGANDYITKPVDFPVALARINTQLSRKNAEDKTAAFQRQLLTLNHELDDRIKQRTERLEAINLTLKQEIARREASELKSYYLAYHDALTGLANRQLFSETLDQHLTECVGMDMPISVLFIDLDGFKSINDTLGHSAGDELLRQVAVLLRNALTERDCVARFGGDEFAILQVDERQPEGAVNLANKLIETLDTPFSFMGNEMSVGASVGIVVDENCTSDSGSLLKAADLAMYRAKASGRGTYRIFTSEMEAEIVARQALEQDLRSAVRRGEFRLHYQPLIDLQRQKIISFEALMRWEHPVRGDVPPSVFVPVAEEIGLITQMGDWALREACREATNWPDDVRVAVNLSPIQFLRGNLVVSVVGALAASGLKPERLELEITESVMLEKTEQNLKALRQLREIGARVSMDDFGTGYSSLSYLRNFRFDKIKIDQSFIKNLTVDAEDLAIVRTILTLGSSFGICTTAEGVETLAQANCLRQEGCSEVQGGLYSMPVPSGEVGGLLARYGQS